MKRISAKITPNSAKPRITEDLLPDEHGNRHFIIHVNAPPQEGKATRAAIVLLSGFLRMPKSKLKLVIGETNKNKVFEIVE
jgi:uncharacterized protein